MSFNQTHFYEQLEQLGKDPNPDTFFFELLTLTGTSKSTITNLKNGTNPIAGSGLNGMARKSHLYFEQVDKATSFDELYTLLDTIKANPAIKRHKIRIIFLTDFDKILAYDTKLDDTLSIERFDEINSDFTFFLPLVGIEKSQTYSEHPADVKASEKMGRLFDQLKKHNDFKQNKDDIHALNLFLTRLLFCFFADDTGIFDKDSFAHTLQNVTQTDGSDLAVFFENLFSVLNLPEDSPERTEYPSYLHGFPYVNGGIFKDFYAIPIFTSRSRRVLIECARLDWSQINPDIFGSMFQAVIDPAQRSQLGQHYTSVSNIKKVIEPLFIAPLRQELNTLLALSDDNKSKNNKQARLENFLTRLRGIKVFDPACGSGNFLITAYKALRHLEMDTIHALQLLIGGKPEFDDKHLELGLGVGYDSQIPLGHFYGIDYDDFPVQIAHLSLYLADHQMNAIFRSKFGHCRDTLPLQQGGHIVQGNSLRTDWQKVCPNNGTDEIYIVGNPPFNGKAKRNEEQKADMELVFKKIKGANTLDYVACWFYKAGQYIQNSHAKMALVATNSIVQGEQVSLLFKPLFDMGLTIGFAYPSFIWRNNARDNATVHVVIIGLTDKNNPLNTPKFIYSHDKTTQQELKQQVENISPYLVDGGDIAVESRNTPLHDGSLMVYGNKPVDGGHLLLTPDEVETLIAKEPQAQKWIKKLLGADEFLNGKTRHCLWLVGISDDELNAMPMVKERVESVRQMRLASKKAQTRQLADTPHLFGEIRQPTSGKYILVPSVSSERRPYIPIDFLNHDVISTNANQIIPNATMFDFGILTSQAHNDWMRLVAGRLESRYRYSGTIVYNTFAFPDVSDDDKATIEQLAKDILRARAMHQGKTLAELYNPETMPDNLKQAHHRLDVAVDKLYREQGFADTAERLAFLLARYEKLIQQEATKKTDKAHKK